MPEHAAGEPRGVAGESGAGEALGTDGRGARARVWGWATAVIGAVSGLAPHVLHHIGPIAGAALVGGALRSSVFGVLGLALSLPFLLRLKRRYGSWHAPALALAIFAVMFAISTLVIGPAISGDGRSEATPAGHESHH